MKLYIVELETGLVSGVDAESMRQLWNKPKSEFYPMLVCTLGRNRIDSLELEWLSTKELEQKYAEKGINITI